MNLVKLWHRIFSRSSACFTAMLILILFMLDSMSTFSLSFLLISIGVRRSSLLARTSTSGLLCFSTIDLGREILQTHCGSKRSSYCRQVRLQRPRLQAKKNSKSQFASTEHCHDKSKNDSVVSLNNF